MLVKRLLFSLLFVFSAVSIASPYDDIANLYSGSRLRAKNVMVGDSLTYLGLWSELLGSNEIANRGIGGDRTELLLERMDAVLSVHPSRAFLMIGVNDAYNQNVTVDQMVENYDKIVNILLENHIQVYLTSTLNCNRVMSKPCAEAQPKINVLNRHIRSLARQHNLVYLDLNARLSGMDGLQARYTGDGIHLNIAGYKVWASLLSPYLYNSTVPGGEQLLCLKSCIAS